MDVRLNSTPAKINDPELQKLTQASTVMPVVLVNVDEVSVLAAELSL